MVFTGYTADIPADFLKTNDPHWIACLSQKIKFSKTELSAIDLVEQLHFPHTYTKAETENSFKEIVKLHSIELDQRTALWELHRQTGAIITIDRNVGYTLDIVMPPLPQDEVKH